MKHPPSVVDRWKLDLKKQKVFFDFWHLVIEHEITITLRVIKNLDTTRLWSYMLYCINEDGLVSGKNVIFYIIFTFS